MKISYTDPRIDPKEVTFSFILEVFLESDSGSPDATVHTDFVVGFVPGVASPMTSFVEQNATEGRIGESLDLKVVFLDIFGKRPAEALFDSTSSSDMLPKVTIETIHAETASSDVIALDVLSSRGPVNNIEIVVQLRAEGYVTIDVRLSNDSVTGFPMTISAFPVQCEKSFEEPDTWGQSVFALLGTIAVKWNNVFHAQQEHF